MSQVFWSTPDVEVSPLTIIMIVPDADHGHLLRESFIGRDAQLLSVAGKQNVPRQIGLIDETLASAGQHNAGVSILVDSLNLRGLGVRKDSEWRFETLQIIEILEVCINLVGRRSVERISRSNL